MVERNVEIIVFFFFNIRLFYKYIDDLKKDFNFFILDVLVLLEICFIELDRDESFLLLGYILYRFDYLCNSE